MEIKDLLKTEDYAERIKKIDSLIKYYQEEKNKIRIAKSIYYQKQYHDKYALNEFDMAQGFRFRELYPNFSDYFEYVLSLNFDYNNCKQTTEQLEELKFFYQKKISGNYLKYKED